MREAKPDRNKTEQLNQIKTECKTQTRIMNTIGPKFANIIQPSR